MDALLPSSPTSTGMDMGFRSQVYVPIVYILNTEHGTLQSWVDSYG